MCWYGVGVDPLKGVQGRVSASLCHGQMAMTYIKTVDAITGTSHVSVWCRCRSVKRCPRSVVYITMSWPNGHDIH